LDSHLVTTTTITQQQQQQQKKGVPNAPVKYQVPNKTYDDFNELHNQIETKLALSYRFPEQLGPCGSETDKITGTRRSIFEEYLKVALNEKHILGLFSILFLVYS